MNPFSENLFQDQVALVTGGGRGIGLAAAKLLAAGGARIAIAQRKTEHLEAGRQALEQAGAEVLAETVDIREPDQTRALVDKVLERYGKLDLLINNAGGQFPTLADSLSPKGWDTVIRTNLTGSWNMTQAAALRAMIPQRRGTIVCVIADIHRGFPGMVHTGAARAGVENFCKTLSIEWMSHGIRINAVAPGVIRTEGVSQYGDEILEARRQEIPMKRLGTAEETAYAICFLASPAASYITGETLYVDGGARLWGQSWPIPDPGAAGAPPGEGGA